MLLTPVQTMLMIVAVMLGTMLTRFLPFWLFPEGKKRPEVVEYLGKVLPAAMIGLLVVYCLKGVSVQEKPYGLPEGIAVTVVVLLHKWRHSVLLSIGVGTALYMMLIRIF